MAIKKNNRPIRSTLPYSPFSYHIFTDRAGRSTNLLPDRRSIHTGIVNC
nr:MAG TPA: hypothetical protein [Caudoviricetes sp.]